MNLLYVALVVSTEAGFISDLSSEIVVSSLIVVGMQWRKQGVLWVLEHPFYARDYSLGYCTLHQVFILPENSADSEYPVNLRIGICKQNR